MDLILTGRPVDAGEAKAIGLVDRVVEPGTALHAAQQLAEELSRFPQVHAVLLARWVRCRSWFGVFIGLCCAHVVSGLHARRPGVRLPTVGTG